MIERSAPLPMHIEMHVVARHMDGVESLAASELLLTASSRIRILRLYGYPADVLSVLNRVHSPSLLESLHLYVFKRREEQSLDLSEALFGGKAPTLRRLEFGDLDCFRMPRWLLAGITHFTTNASPFLDELLNELQSMPQLEVLCIRHRHRALNVTDPHRQLPRRRAALPRLSLLSIHDDTPPHPVILSSHIDAPLTVRRHFFWNTWTWDNWDSRFTAMQALVPRDSAPSVDDGGLRIAHMRGGPDLGSFEVWSRTGFESASSTSREDALFLFNVGWFRHPYERGANVLPNFHTQFFLLASLCAQLRTTRIEDLTVSPEKADTIALATIIYGSSSGESATDVPDASDVAVQWQALLAALPSVKTLRLHSGGPACLSVLRALSTSAVTLLPHLKKVLVVHCSLHFATGSGPPDGVAGSGSAVASREFFQENVGTELVETVNGRSGLELELVGCEVDNKALEALRKRARVFIGDERAHYDV